MFLIHPVDSTIPLTFKADIYVDSLIPESKTGHSIEHHDNRRDKLWDESHISGYVTHLWAYNRYDLHHRKQWYMYLLYPKKFVYSFPLRKSGTGVSSSNWVWSFRRILILQARTCPSPHDIANNEHRIASQRVSIAYYTLWVDLTVYGKSWWLDTPGVLYQVTMLFPPPAFQEYTLPLWFFEINRLCKKHFRSLQEPGKAIC